jgi:hypothetical protein
VSAKVAMASPVDAVAVAEPDGEVGFDSMVDLWTESFSSSSFDVMDFIAAKRVGLDLR